MHRLLSICITGGWLAGMATCAFGQTPEAASMPSGPIAPRTDLNSVYQDAYANPDSVCPPPGAFHGGEGSATGEAMEGLWKNGPLVRLYGGVDYMYYYRTKPDRKVLTRTTADLFPGAAGFINADIENRFYGDNTSQSPNDPFINGGTLLEVLQPNEERMTTDELDPNGRNGYRPKIGLVLSSGNKVEFSYMWFDDFESPAVSEDVSQAAFRLGQISFQTGAVFRGAPQRFGYLNAPFFTRNPAFAGEARRSSSETSLFPHNPLNENPSVFPANGVGPLPFFFPGAFVSGDIPREPTNGDDDDDSTAPNAQNFDIATFGSFLWRDGEVAIANYSFDLQGAELVYKRSILSWSRNNWELTGTFGIRYIGMDENFNFFFADTVFDRRAANPGTAPIDTAGTTPVSQPANETWATYTNTIDNDMYGPQIGIEAKLPFCYYFDVELMGKGGFVVNSLQNHVSTYRGDGLVLNDYTKEVTATGGIIEGRFGINFRPIKRLTIFGGYEFLWLKGVGTGIGTIDFELDQQRRPGHEEDVLFHGAVGRVEFLF